MQFGKLPLYFSSVKLSHACRSIWRKDKDLKAINKLNILIMGEYM
jgi:hypothetical protein